MGYNVKMMFIIDEHGWKDDMVVVTVVVRCFRPNKGSPSLGMRPSFQKTQSSMLLKDNPKAPYYNKQPSKAGRQSAGEIGRVDERVLLKSWAPSLVCKSEKHTRDFLWEEVDEGHSFYLGNNRGGLSGGAILGREEGMFLCGTLILDEIMGAEEDLDHLFWDCHYAWVVWSSFLQEFGVSFASFRSVRATIEEFLLHQPFRDKGFFYGLSRCALLLGTFGPRGMNEYFGVGRGSIVRFGFG
ncbi:uncharacterized protein E5676_scaffold350G001350 [Cucumis melo var. makuwa]|uniref:Uncharacterized protein n=1 Tax=Cucumis melo var. makuwa TaxID=1194695 RepID=A0A5A7UUK8_CUCMM|nr:uncharacterized protein E6C27_scaffold274G001330 [Cucumis melo var. makuwa]TYJ98529.1 uncharacterized protein E5676_scaffold350G001350 [Cucumis melo var. makuwa]